MEQMEELVVQMFLIFRITHSAEICAIGSQFGHAGIGTPTHLFLSSAYISQEFYNLVIASAASSLPILSAVFSTVSIACDKPPGHSAVGCKPETCMMTLNPHRVE